MGVDDKTLVRRAAGGDQRAFRQLVERYQRKVYTVALGMLKDPEAARDAAQDAIVKVYRYLPRFNGEASFYTWLYRITVNICIDMIRKKSATPEPSGVEFTEAIAHDVDGEEWLAPSVDPQGALLTRELNQHLTEAVQSLPEAHRQILLLREIDGMSYEDLARTLNIPKGTVMSRLFHARVKLQGLLRRYTEEQKPAKVGAR